MSNNHNLLIKPKISYPRVVNINSTYLMTIDLQPEEEFAWEVDEEEYPVYCSLESELFNCSPIREPIVLLHRFGGNYGSANFLISVSKNISDEAKQQSSDQINIVLSNKYGVSFKSITIEGIRISEAFTTDDSENQELVEASQIKSSKSITQIDLSNRELISIPAEVWQHPNLKTLILDNNRLTELPSELLELKSLEKLSANSNQITEIPDDISQLEQLKELHLNSNQITSIPESLERLSYLETLDLRKNPLPISPSILGASELDQEPGNISDIISYCRQLRSGEVRPLNEAKLVLVGQGSVGKTSLIKYLVRGNYFNPHESQTDGLSVTDWMININTQDVRLNIWDFGGQEIYHATHQFFLTKRSLYLLVCNCRTSEEENRIDYWLKLIQSFGDKSPVIIVGNKRDEQPLDINREALRAKYPNIKDILETSCVDGLGIDQLTQAILREVGQLKEVYDLLPVSWFNVKAQLESLDKDFIKYSKYEGICEKQGIYDDKDQTQLIDLLHNLGLVLNFREHPLLKNINVLNPDWVTQGIYALFSDDNLKTEAKGQLTLKDLSRILPSERYPKDHHQVLIVLMEEFQLCFQLPECSPPRYLIPGLLPKKEPEDTALEGETLDFQYHYTILPDSVMSRFIVLLYDKIHRQICWRSGVMLAYTEDNKVSNIARVTGDPADNKIFITINGKESTRRLFLGLIRDVFKKIHSNFAKPTEWVPVPGHPDHPPLDYQELLGLEALGEQNFVIGKLKLKVSLRQLLDGYEPIAIRRLRQKGVDIATLKQRTQSDENNDIHIAAIQELARNWKDDPETVLIMKERIQSDENTKIRTTALQELAHGWKDDPDIFDWLKALAQDDKNKDIRESAGRELVRGWKDNPETLSVLKHVFQNDDNHNVRSMAVQELAHGWKDDSNTLPIIRHRVKNDESSNVRDIALQELARGWKNDPDTLPIIKTRAQTDDSSEVRTTALQELARGWKDDPDTLLIIKNRAQDDEDEDVRSNAVQELAKDWKDDPDTLPIIKTRAQTDDSSEVRMTALRELARGWKDDPDTLTLLRYQAQEDESSEVRTFALQELTRGWKDDPQVAQFTREQH